MYDNIDTPTPQPIQEGEAFEESKEKSIEVNREMGTGTSKSSESSKDLKPGSKILESVAALIAGPGDGDTGSGRKCFDVLIGAVLVKALMCSLERLWRCMWPIKMEDSLMML